ncbi:MAG: phospho-sugar mutase [Clostridia bacterium]|nr:phospho-sugar mutase [Clostridia bacterium]
MSNYIQEYERWLNFGELDGRLKADLIAIRGDEDEIQSRFGCDLVFGTGGLRGIMGGGTNRMNIYTVRRASRGFGNYIVSLGKEAMDRGIVIAYDCRNNGTRFAMETALTMCALGIHVRLFDSLRPTPELSFAIRDFGAIGGVNITASHNPKEYNGYKAYFEDGAQLSGDQADFILGEMQKVDPLNVETMAEEEAKAKGLLEIIGEETDQRYLARVLAEQLDLGELKPEAKELSIVYTPFHGTGYKLVPEIFKALGANVSFVEEQMIPNGDFPTVKSPNPEEKEGFTLGLELAKKVNADLIIATDPDADRVGVAALNGDSVTLFTGNQMAALLIEFMIEVEKKNGKLPANAAVVSTIVSSKLPKRICQQNGVAYFEVLTGFKYIGEMMERFKQNGDYSYFLGFEESYGYLKGDYARDKDSLVASMLIAQMAMYYKNKNKNLVQALEDIYQKYGYYVEDTVSFKIEAVMPQQRMDEIMANLRENIPETLGGRKVVEFRDYKKHIIRDIATGKEKETGLPTSDVLYFIFEDSTHVVVRPSGTEPKVKAYFLTGGENRFDCTSKIDSFKKVFAELLK